MQEINKLKPCVVIGVLDNAMAGLTELTQLKIQQADYVIAGKRTIELFQNQFLKTAEVFDLTGKLMQLPVKIDDALRENKKVIVLATGDPLCHGIGTFLVKKLGKEKIEIMSNTSILQLAFSHLGESWQNAKIASIHSADSGEWLAGSTPKHGLYGLLQNIKQHDLLAIYTSPENSPERIARMLIMEQMDKDYEFFIFEKLLQAEQKITLHMSVARVSKSHFSTPNLVVLKRRKEKGRPVLFGYQDDFFAQRKPEKGLITRRDVRAVVFAKMQLRRDSVVWDIGAASGSVGLEAAMLCQLGHVYAIEKNCVDLSLIETNRVAMGLLNYTVVCAKAPDKMTSWPSPDAVFIGGSAGNLEQLIKLIMSKLNIPGTLVMNFISLENMNDALAILKSLSLEWELTQLQASHSRPILNMHRLQADNPVWILTVSKPSN